MYNERRESDAAALEKFLAAWIGHASHADTRNLLASLKLELHHP